MAEIPKDHPRYQSLMMRQRIIDGVKRGVATEAALVAHGRGEAFDYLLGERTHEFGWEAIRAASAMLLTAKHPMFSVNGNVVSLAGLEVIELNRENPEIGIEINIFHFTPERIKTISVYLRELGATRFLEAVTEGSVLLGDIGSNRRYMNPEGIAKADVVLVPLEDGDRCEALVASGRKVITVDLNPLSRTARTAQITIVDELSRVMQNLREQLKQDRMLPAEELSRRIASFDNRAVLQSAEKAIREGLRSTS